MEKSKTIKSRKSNTDKASTKNKKANVTKKWPEEDDIREKAQEIYHQRIERGEYGTPSDDWFEAERVLGESE